MKRLFCNLCGVEFGLQPMVLALWKKTGRAFFCPNGHAIQFNEVSAPTSMDRVAASLGEMAGDIVKLRREAVELKGAAVDARQRAEQLEAKLAEAEGVQALPVKRKGASRGH